MKTTVTLHSFRRAFEDAGRSDQFSREAQESLFEYLEDLERDTGEEYELDVIGLCVEWTEYDSALEAAAAYGWAPPPFDPADGEDPEDYAATSEDEARDWLDYRSHVISVEGGGVLVLDF